MSQYMIYHHTHSRDGYHHTEYLCFVCASQQASMIPKGKETIHPITVEDGGGYRTECTTCHSKLNWMDT